MTILAEHTDVRIRKFLQDFGSLFPKFRTTWTDEQLRETWLPIVQLMTVDQLAGVLDYYKFHFVPKGHEQTRGPSVRSFRNRCLAERARPIAQTRVLRDGEHLSAKDMKPPGLDQQLADLKESLREFY